MSRGTSERGAVLLHTRQACSARPVTKILAHAFFKVLVDSAMVLAF
jgi:hypothetical protein